MMLMYLKTKLNYETIGFALAFKNPSAKDLLAMANGNALRLIPAFQWLYTQTDQPEMRNRIKDLTLEILFK